MYYCICGQTRKSGYIPDKENFPDNTYWVCANCGLIPEEVFQILTSEVAPKDATAFLSCVGDGEGSSVLTWAGKESGERIKTVLFKAYPRKIDMPGYSQGRNALLHFWKKLDTDIDTIRSLQTNDYDREYAKAHATALSEMIAYLMPQFYADQTAILAESMTRWTARQEGREHESPGLAESIWDPSTRFDGTIYEDSKPNPAPGKAHPITLDSAKQGFIKLQLDSGAFPPEELAKMFSVSVEVIKYNYDLVS